MTGDQVPGLDEEFAYFRAVHVFEDGGVGFNAVETRFEGLFRSSPRAIYFSNSSGALTEVAGLANEDAFRPFGVPNTILDSSLGKTFAFDYFDTEHFVPVLARRLPGAPLEALTPEDESFMFVSHSSLPETSFFSLRFLTIHGSIMLNGQGKILVDATFDYEDSGLGQKRGLFVATERADVRKIIFEGDGAPGIPDGTFATVRGAYLADDGNVFFTSELTGDGVSTATNETIWRELDGELALVLREGDPAPGFPGMLVNGLALNIFVAGINAEHAVFFAGASQPGGQVRRTLWIGETAGGPLAPIIQYTQNPSLEIADYFTATDQGAVAFTDVDTNAIILDDSGNVYLDANGLFADDSDIRGIWKFRKDAGLELLLPSSPSMSNLRLLSANNLGGIAFLADTDGTEGVWTRSPTGELTKLMGAGDTVEGRSITGFAHHGTFSGLASETTKSLGTPTKFTQLNDNGDLVFVARFADTDDDEDTRSDEAILLAASIPPPTESFLWNGEGDDGDWHTIMNWEELDSGVPATRAPGDEPGTDDVVIPNSTVTIDNRAVELANLSANGALVVNQPLTLHGPSIVEALELDADLTVATLELVGDSRWLTGSVMATETNASVTATNGLTFVSGANGGGDSKSLSATLIVPGRVTHDANVILDINGGGILIQADGRYTLGAGGAIQTDFRIFSRIENQGSLIVMGSSGESPTALRTNLDNSGGDINVTAGKVRMDGFLVMDGGTISMDPGASMELMETAGSIFIFGAVIREDSVLQGEGELRFHGGSLAIDENVIFTSGLDVDSGVLSLGEDIELRGKGTLLNRGFLVVNKATSTLKIVNEGSFVVTGPDDGVNLSVTRGTVENRNLMRIEQFVSLDSEPGADRTVALENSGRLELDGDGRVFSRNPDAIFRNTRDGTVTKGGEMVFEILSEFESEGALEVVGGTLSLGGGGAFGSPQTSASTTSVAGGATLLLDSFTGSPDHVFQFAGDHAFSGGGNIIVEDGQLEIARTATLTNSVENLEIRGAITNLRFEGAFENTAGTVSFSSTGQSPVLSLENNFLNEKNGVVVLGSGFSIQQKSRPGAQSNFINRGKLDIQGGNIRFSDLTADGSPEVLFRCPGEITFSGGGEQNRYIAEVDVMFNTLDLLPSAGASILDQSGKMKFVAFSSAAFSNFASDTFGLTLAGHFLHAGTWEVEAGSEVQFLTHAGGLEIPLGLDGIGPGAHAILHGSVDIPDGNLAGLLQPPDGFENEGRLTLLGATLQLQGGFINTGLLHGDPGRIEIPSGHSFSNSGDVTGGVIMVGMVENSGRIAPGNSPGIVRIEGDFSQGTGGNIFLELGGSVAGTDYDQFLVDGLASLGGRLTLGCVDGIFPDQGTVFRPLVAGGFEGDFDEIIFDVPSGRQRFILSRSATDLTAEAEILDVTTFEGWRQAVFTAPQLADNAISGFQADPEGDGLTTLAEYVFDGNPWVANPQLVALAVAPADPGGPHTLQVSFPWAKGVSDYTYVIEWSGGLDFWTPLAHQVTSQEDLGLTTRLDLSADFPSGAAGFVRLSVQEL